MYIFSITYKFGIFLKVKSEMQSDLKSELWSERRSEITFQRKRGLEFDWNKRFEKIPSNKVWLYNQRFQKIRIYGKK